MSRSPNERMNAIEAAARRVAVAIRKSEWIDEKDRTFTANAFEAFADEIVHATAPLSDDANERMSDKDRDRFDELFQEYVRHAHGVQAGIGMKLELDPTFGTAKDIRTGLDTSKADQGGLVNLLIMKGVFTDVEYMEAIVTSMKQEHRRWEEEISQVLGTDTVLT
jgi:hypothetical protein